MEPGGKKMVEEKETDVKMEWESKRIGGRKKEEKEKWNKKIQEVVR